MIDARFSSTAATPRVHSPMRASLLAAGQRRSISRNSVRTPERAMARATDMATSVLPWLGTTDVNRHTLVSRADCCSNTA